MNLTKLLLLFMIGISFPCRGDDWRIAYQVMDESIKTEVKRCLDGAPEKTWHIKNISNWYREWLPSNEYLVKITKDSSTKIVIVHLDGGGNGGILNKSEGVPLISSILSRRLKQLPNEARERLLLTRRIAELRFNPVYTVGSKNLLHGGFDDWLHGSAEKKAVLTVLFEEYCKGPAFNLNRKENEWRAEFFMFKWNGGVDKVNASGKIDPFSLESVFYKEELKAGSFSWPYYGG